MKKTLSIILVLFVLGQCVILDPLGLTNDRIKGSEAASQIKICLLLLFLLRVNLTNQTEYFLVIHYQNYKI